MLRATGILGLSSRVTHCDYPKDKRTLEKSRFAVKLYKKTDFFYNFRDAAALAAKTKKKEEQKATETGKK